MDVDDLAHRLDSCCRLVVEGEGEGDTDSDSDGEGGDQPQPLALRLELRWPTAERRCDAELAGETARGFALALAQAQAQALAAGGPPPPGRTVWKVLQPARPVPLPGGWHRDDMLLLCAARRVPVGVQRRAVRAWLASDHGDGFFEGLTVGPPRGAVSVGDAAVEAAGGCAAGAWRTVTSLATCVAAGRVRVLAHPAPP